MFTQVWGRDRNQDSLFPVVLVSFPVMVPIPFPFPCIVWKRTISLWYIWRRRNAFQFRFFWSYESKFCVQFNNNYENNEVLFLVTCKFSLLQLWILAFPQILREFWRHFPVGGYTYCKPNAPEYLCSEVHPFNWLLRTRIIFYSTKAKPENNYLLNLTFAQIACWLKVDVKGVDLFLKVVLMKSEQWCLYERLLCNCVIWNLKSDKHDQRWHYHQC